MYKALYDFESTYNGTLSFKAGDRFTVLEKQSGDWWTAQNGFGELGYIPANYISKDEVEHCEVLRSIDSAIEALHLQAASSGGHYNHQQRENLQKLIRHRRTVVEEQRCERATTSPNRQLAKSSSATKRQSSKKHAAPPPPTNLPTESSESHQAAKDSTCTSVSGDGKDQSSACNTFTKDLTAKIPPEFGLDLVEAVRRNTELSYDKSVIAVETVLGMIKATLPETAQVMDAMAELLQKQVPSDNIENSQDADRLRTIFKKLVQCKDDSQQRSWSLYEDESMISEQLEQLLSILTDASQSICQRVVAEDHYEAVHDLVLYYQMETRRTIRLLLLQVFGALCGLTSDIVTMFLCSVLPLELVRDIQADLNDIQKVCYSSLVLTMVFSTADSVPFNHYEHLNGSFVSFLLDNIEDPPEDDCDEQIPDMFINLLLAFNLHFQSPTDNTVMKELARHGVAKTKKKKVPTATLR